MTASPYTEADDENTTRITLLSSRGSPDLLINNAAIINKNAPLWQVPAEEFDLLIDINVKGVANVIRHFVPAMVARKSGVIVNFSSGWGRSVAADVASRCAARRRRRTNRDGIRNDGAGPSPSSG